MGMSLDEEWKAEWRPVIDQVGTDFSSGDVAWAADRIEVGAIRRYLEPLEFDCPLHYDEEVARSQGYDGIVLPYTALLTFAKGAFWSPGTALFTDPARDAQPAQSNLKPYYPKGAPSFTGYFATDLSMEYLRPVCVGERLGRRGNKLVGCSPRETKVGRGAFLSYESELVNEALEVVMRLRSTVFLYNPHPRAS